MSDPDSRLDSTSLERIVPDELRAGEATGEETLRLHMERYQFAQQHLIRGSLLDIACGVGYGTRLLSENSLITTALGVDIDDGAVQYAAKHYATARLSYVRSDALQFSSSQTFDNIVSLETIEHVDDPRAVFAHFVGLLAPGGRLIASVPVTPSVDGNPHHKTNFSVRSFRAMGNAFSLKFVNSSLSCSPLARGRLQRARKRVLLICADLARFYLSNPSSSYAVGVVHSTVGFVNKYLTVVWEK
jgi:SAM-dependent methyltransferase